MITEVGAIGKRTRPLRGTCWSNVHQKRPSGRRVRAMLWARRASIFESRARPRVASERAISPQARPTAEACARASGRWTLL